jgi:hypothetical protein
MGIPPDANAAFVAAMEDILEVYQRPFDPQRPLVWLDDLPLRPNRARAEGRAWRLGGQTPLRVFEISSMRWLSAGRLRAAVAGHEVNRAAYSSVLS